LAKVAYSRPFISIHVPEEKPEAIVSNVTGYDHLAVVDTRNGIAAQDIGELLETIRGVQVRMRKVSIVHLLSQHVKLELRWDDG
jgi:hypothetical protein